MVSVTDVFTIFGEFLVLLFKLCIYFLEACFRAVIPPSKKDVAGKVVLITGAGHGMGRCMAKRFAKLQARVVIWDINEAGNSRTAKDIQTQGGEVYAYTVDVTKKEKVYETAAKVRKEVGKVDILINNAGILVGELLLELTDDQIQRVMNVNIMSHFWMIRAFLPDMLTAKEGHIMSISSAAGYFGKNYLIDYSTSKFAVTGLDESLEIELAKNYKGTNIKQTIVHPFIVNTGLVHGYTSRFMPLIEEDDAADAMVDGVLRNRRKVFIPSDLRLSVALKNLVPHKSYLALADFFKSETCSQGKQN